MNSIQKRVTCVGIVIIIIIGLVGLGICELGSIALREMKLAEQKRKAEQEKVSAIAHEICDTLYVPAGAVVLDEVEADDLLAYGPGCVGTVIQIVYGVNRQFAEVMAEYDRALCGDGWEWSVRRPVEGYATYLRSPQVELEINKLDEGEITVVSTPIPDVQRQFWTIYAVTIVYTEPSNKECTG